MCVGYESARMSSQFGMVARVEIGRLGGTEALTTRALAVRPSACVPPGMTLGEGVSESLCKRKRCHYWNPSCLNFCETSATVPGGVRCTRWSIVRVFTFDDCEDTASKVEDMREISIIRRKCAREISVVTGTWHR